MANTYLSKTHGASPTNLKKWTFSAWIKRTKLTGANQKIFSTAYVSAGEAYIFFDSANRFSFGQYEGGGSANNFYKTTSRKFRDVNAWFHIQVTWDTTLSTAADRIKLYVNGEELTDYTASANATQNVDGVMNTNRAHYLSSNAGGSMFFEGLMSHVHFTDGYAYAPTAFGETDSTTGEWKIKADPSVTYGNNGFFLFKDNAAVTDQSGNSNNYTLGGGTLTKTEDSPSNVFATLNPLLTHSAHGYSLTYGLGSNKITFNEPSTWTYTTSTIAGINGKFYAEFKIDAVGSEASIGVIASDTVNTNQTSGGLNDYLGKETDSIGYLNDGRTFKNNSAQQTGLTAISAGNILGVALDTENNTCQFYINGSSSGNAVSLTADKFYHFGVSGYNGTQISCNFGNGYFGTTAVSTAGTNASGNGIFEYDVPANHTALSTKGLNL